MSTATKHVSAVLKLPARVKSVGAYAQNIITSCTGNAFFPNPSPPLATLEADLTAFNTAEALVLNRTKGAADSRNAKLATLKADLEHLMDYVRGIADATPANAEAIIQSAGMAVRKVPSHVKGPLTATPGSVSGDAKLMAKAVAHRASYEWQYSTDQKTWTNAPTTLQAKTDISGLTPATTYYFRFRGVTKAGEGAFSQVVSLLMT
jgi:hypothetical protein